MSYVSAHGIPTEDSYPYTARDGECKDYVPAFFNSGFSGVTPNSPAQMKVAVNKNPVAVAIMATPEFQHYTSGIMDLQTPPGINHAVLLIGYGHDDALNEDYWLVRNSWATVWGEEGYFRFKRTDEDGPGVANILTLGAYPTPVPPKE